MLTDEEYVAKKGLHCIDKECDGVVRLGSSELQNDALIAWCSCDKCERSWMEVYQLTGYIA